MYPVSHAVRLLPGSEIVAEKGGGRRLLGEITCQAKKQGQRIQRLRV